MLGLDGEGEPAHALFGDHRLASILAYPAEPSLRIIR